MIDVRSIATQYVKPFLKGQKNDDRDAASLIRVAASVVVVTAASVDVRGGECVAGIKRLAAARHKPICPSLQCGCPTIARLICATGLMR
jgi:hypothetical protein